MTCSVGPKRPYIANAYDLKHNTHSTRASKQKLDELLKPFDGTTSSQRPDGLIENMKLWHIFTIEVARIDDSPDFLLLALVQKMCKYNQLLQALRMVPLQYVANSTT